MLMYTKLQALDKKYSDASNFPNLFYLKLQLFLKKKYPNVSSHPILKKKSTKQKKFVSNNFKIQKM